MRCGTATDEMWDNGYGEMGWKDGDRQGKYRQEMTDNLWVYCQYGIMGRADRVSGEDIGG